MNTRIGNYQTYKIVGQVAYVFYGACRPVIQMLVKQGYKLVFVKKLPD